MSNALLISLGHNSSAIYTNGTGVIGYEQERLDKIKSSSRPPIKALFEIERHCGVPQNTPAFITHWFDKFDTIPECKYFNGVDGYLQNKRSRIVTHSRDFTHHDAHAWSSYSFYRYYRLTARKPPAGDIMHFIVADGFGNNQEVVSIYEMSISKDTGPKLIHRVYGYECSLGLMYQYATEFCGMKMNQDEYKFLGYESKILKYYNPDDPDLKFIELEALTTSGFLLHAYQNTEKPKETKNQLIDFASLEHTKLYWQEKFSAFISRLNIQDRTTTIARSVIACYIQKVVEKTIYAIVKSYKMDNVCLSGGLFYNVKLNNKILKAVPGHFSVVPVAGDQGAAIGFYQKFIGDFNWSTLAIGQRGLYDIDFSTIKNKKESNIFVPQSREEVIDLLKTKLLAGEICNFVSSRMEYGPRALGHTSSLFLPTKENADINNRLNNRNEVMPFAPLIHDANLINVFNNDQYKKVVGSDHFMIVTYDYINPITDEYAGVYHNYPDNSGYSGRPQAVTSKTHSILYEVMFDLYVYNRAQMITNTSYNYHGEPIVFSLMDILQTHGKQMGNRLPGDPSVNLIIYPKSF